MRVIDYFLVYVYIFRHLSIRKGQYAAVLRSFLSSITIKHVLVLLLFAGRVQDILGFPCGPSTLFTII